jgi:hypothetical protein
MSAIEHFHTRIAMIAPTRTETYVTQDGESYRMHSGDLVHVKPEHVTELEGRGFRLVAPPIVEEPPAKAKGKK